MAASTGSWIIHAEKHDVHCHVRFLTLESLVSGRSDAAKGVQCATELSDETGVSPGVAPLLFAAPHHGVALDPEIRRTLRRAQRSIALRRNCEHRLLVDPEGQATPSHQRPVVHGPVPDPVTNDEVGSTHHPGLLMADDRQEVVQQRRGATFSCTGSETRKSPSRHSAWVRRNATASVRCQRKAHIRLSGAVVRKTTRNADERYLHQLLDLGSSHRRAPL